MPLPYAEMGQILSVAIDINCTMILCTQGLYTLNDAYTYEKPDEAVRLLPLPIRLGYEDFFTEETAGPVQKRQKRTETTPTDESVFI
jgi:hypothetical protein